MPKIVKNKNLLEFYTDDNKKYCYDINTGDFIGVSGRILKYPPKTIKDMACFVFLNRFFTEKKSLLQYMLGHHLHFGYFSKNPVYTRPIEKEEVINSLKCCDKLDSLSFNCFDEDNKIYTTDLLNIDNLNFINDNFKKFIKYANANSDWTIKGFHGFILKQKLLNDTEFNEYNIDYDFLIKADELKWTKEQIEVALYFLYKEKLSGLITDEFLYSLGIEKYQFNYTILMNIIDTYFKYCDYLHIKPKKGNFMRLYADTKESYKIAILNENDKKLSKNQLKYKNIFNFNDDNFTVIIPTTKKEFIDETNQQNNCVYKTYYNQVVDGETNIVFIRKKDNPNKSYITCEIYDGRIIQFLKKNNNCCTQDKELIFKAKYQEHLDKNWKKRG